MKAILVSILLLAISLNASEEFPLIEPYAVEDAPVVVVVPEVIPEPVVVAKKEEIVVEKTNSTQERKDSDNDGVFDDKDNCPDTSKEFMVDGYGCPQTAILNINFPSRKSKITDDLIDDLKGFAQFLKDNVGYQVIIYGHTDSIGDEAYNQKLSQQRADTVKEALIRYDISDIRLTAIGKGEKEPIADNMNKEGRAQNRRIEVELLQ